MPRLPAWIRTRQQEPDREPIRLGVALAIAFGLAILISMLLIPVALAWFDPKTVGDRVNVVKGALTVIAGIGGVVALVVAYRRQQVAENAERLAEAGEVREQSRLYAERFDKASDKLGSDSAAVRLAGVHALANLADDWEEGRQTCIDVLCAYLRMPPSPEPDSAEDPGEHTHWQAMQEVRTTIIRLIASHLRHDASPAWHGANLDFAGVRFDTDANFSFARFSDGSVNFDRALFCGGQVSFGNAQFSGSEVSFYNAAFSGGAVDFGGADFSGGDVKFSSAEFSGGNVSFGGASFSGGGVHFNGAQFSGGDLNFNGAEFSDRIVEFTGAKFSSGDIYFGYAEFSGGYVAFLTAEFSGSTVEFRSEFLGGEVTFRRSKFSGGEVSFSGSKFSGGEVSFYDAAFSGGAVDFSSVADWSHPPLHLPSPPHDVVIQPPSHGSPHAR